MAQIYRRSPIMVKQTNETTPMERPGALYRSCRGHIWVGRRRLVSRVAQDVKTSRLTSIDRDG